LGTSNRNIGSSTNINVSTVTSYSFQDLPSEIRHFAESGVITILPLKPGTKEPKLSKWKTYQTRQYPLNVLKRHKGNFGVITGSTGKGWSNLVILDIDDKKGPEGLYRHFKDLDTLQVKTASKGYHIYFWSEKPVEDHNYIGKTFNLDIELRGKRKIYCVLPPSSVYYPDTDFVGGHEVIKMGEKYPLMELDDPEEFIKDILLEAGYKIQRQITKEHDTPPAPIFRDGTWEHNLTSEQVTRLTDYLKPLYKEGQRQDLTLYLSGWFYKAEVSPESALEVINHLSNGDSEQRQRILALKNTYRGGMALKGSSGVWELLEDHYTTKHQGIEDTDKRDKQIDTDTREHYGRIARIVVHPNSILGIQKAVKYIREAVRGKQKKALKEIQKFLRARYSIIKDKISYEIAIYNPENGYYEFYDNDYFHEFLLDVFKEEIFTMEETKTIKKMFARMQEPSDKHIVFQNGILNLETLELEEFTPDHFLTFKVPYNWNEKAKGNYVEEKLREILIDIEGDDEGDTSKYQNYLELVGYILGEPGNPRQKIFLFIGPPGSGKTQIINLIAGLVKGGVSSVPLHQFKNNFGLQTLIGKRVNTLFDISEEEISDPSVIKAVSGNDSITIERKYKESVTFENGLPVKTVGAGNVLPKIKDETLAIARRLNITKVNNDFSDKPVANLSEKLLEDNEGMEWLIYNSITKYHEMKEEEKGFTLDYTPHEMHQEYLKLADPCLYAMERLFEVSNDETDFYTTEELVSSINKLLAEEGLRIPKDKKQHHYPAIRHVGGELVQRRINKDRAYGYSLIRARSTENDPKKTRLDTESLIDIIPTRKKELFREGNDDEKNLMDLMKGIGPYNLAGVILEAREHYSMDKNSVMRVLNKWKNEKALSIDNGVYERDK